jgi:c-di-GMP-binding flagellar brake protein YcgR
MIRKPMELNADNSFKTSEGQRLRVFERAAVVGHVIIHDEARLFIAPLVNLSAGGLFVDQLVSIPTGRPVRIVVKSPKLSHPVQAKGTVVRIEQKNRRGMAVEFTSISSRAREVIQNCVFEARMETALKVA